jgi:hypothetical protein
VVVISGLTVYEQLTVFEGTIELYQYRINIGKYCEHTIFFLFKDIGRNSKNFLSQIFKIFVTSK